MSPPIEGRANKRLLEVIAAHFNTKKYKVKIVKGETQKEKIIEVEAEQSGIKKNTSLSETPPK